ncbi:hypothetical protein RFI_13641 [Reticulomyxa filosa]|uniref:Fe2OG dioxygenase domain-containing protein n=1 Tax=Reticulomyxa filosa TaxID=46433 RepID=X6NBZ6_RETFI|nr:hypothetical protein RFI_13641 [Reticulomyxa filosa]|eukprot:ETO23541.1 hypothetical protein RFI_13641 [Reticulomyxa filosa]
MRINGFAIIEMPSEPTSMTTTTCTATEDDPPMTNCKGSDWLSLYSQIRQLYSHSFSFFLQHDVNSKQKKSTESKGEFLYRCEGFHRELIEFVLPHSSPHSHANMHSCKKTESWPLVNNSLYEVSCEVTSILLKYGELRSKELKSLHLSEQLDWKKDCDEQSCLRVLHYPSPNFLQSKSPSKSSQKIASDYNSKLTYYPHCDLGVVTLSPKASTSGLEVCLSGANQWIDIDSLLNENDLLVHSGYTLSCITGSFYQPLFHRVNMNLARDLSAPRFSMPYFLRLNDNIKIPVLQLETCLKLMQTDPIDFTETQNSNEDEHKNKNEVCIHFDSNDDYKTSDNVEKWTTVAQFMACIRKERALRKLHQIHSRLCVSFIIKILLWLYPHKQNELFDEWLKE